MLRRLYLLFFSTCAVLAPLPAWGVTSQWVVNGPSRVRVVTPYLVAPAEGEVRLGLEVRLAPGWHSYWKNSGDAGYPPTVQLGGDGVVSGVELLWPAPRRFELPGGLVAFGYEDEVVYPLRARLAAAGRGEVRLTAAVDYVVCAETCIPYQASIQVRQPVGTRVVEDAATAPLVARWWRQVPRPIEEISGAETGGALVPGGGGAAQSEAAPRALEVWVRGAKAAGGEAGLFFEPHELFELGKPVERARADGISFRVPLAARQAGKALPERIPFTWTITGLVYHGRPLAIEARREVGEAARSAELPRRGDSSEPDVALPAALRAAQTAAAAVAAILLALYLWGMLGRPEPREASLPRRPWRELLGFGAAAGAFWALYALAFQLSREALAGVELALLGLALCAWLRRRAARGGMLAGALTGGLLACAALAVWLAHRGRI